MTADGSVTHEEQEGYDGAATVLTGTVELAVRVRLRGHFEPIDGRFHWYGRIDADPALDAAVDPGDTVELRTPHGVASGRLSDVDPWGRLRIAGLGRPPF